MKAYSKKALFASHVVHQPFSWLLKCFTYCLFFQLMCLTALLFCSSITYAQQTSEKNILAVMSAQTTAWNNGDIDAFMQTYWNNDSLLFVGKNGITYGWKNTLEHYKKAYPDRAAMGTLHFTILKLQKLSDDYYNVVGKWHLKRFIGDVGGHFSLLFKKLNGRWLIVQDHSS